MQSDPRNQGFALPITIHPLTSTCIQIEVPNDPAYMQAVLGSLFDTTQWINWQRDAGKHGVQAAQVMKLVWNAIDWSGGCEMYAVRQDPLNPCIIEASTDGGVIWSPIVDISLCVAQIFPPTNPPGYTQPGSQTGGSTPTPGQCFTLNLTIGGNQQVLIPYPVTDGWTVEVSDITGAWADGPTITADWACYDGHEFFLGSCGPITFPGQSTDPLPGSNHLALVLRGPAAPLTALASGIPYTVPNGTGTGNYVLQTNDAPISDNQGAIALKLQVCAPHTPPITCTAMNLTTGQHGWVNTPPSQQPPAISGATNTGHYVAGKGFELAGDGVGVGSNTLYGQIIGTFATPPAGPIFVTVGYYYESGGVGYVPNIFFASHRPGDPPTTWTTGSGGGETPSAPGTHHTYGPLGVTGPLDQLAIGFFDFGGGWPSTVAYIESVLITGC